MSTQRLVYTHSPLARRLGSVGDQAERGAALAAMTSWSTRRVRRGGWEPLTTFPRAQAPTEGVSKRILGNSQRPCTHPRGVAQVLPAPTPVPDQSDCVQPSRKITFLCKIWCPGIRVPASVHSRSLSSFTVDHCSAAFTPFSVILDARETSIAHAESVCAPHRSCGPDVTPRLVRLFDESTAVCMRDVTVCAVRIW